MTSNYRLAYQFVLAVFVVLVTACGQVGPTSTTNSVASQPALLPGATLTLTNGTPMPTLTRSAELISGTTTQQAAPTEQTTSPTSPPTELIPTSAPPTAAPQPAPSPTASRPTFPPTIALEPAFTEFQSPVYLTHSGEDPSGTSHLFIVEKAGRIRLVENGVVQPTPFLDITDRVGSEKNEQGLLSVAFPPDFATRGLFYVDYTDRRGNTVIARYRLLDGDPPQADPASEQRILQIEQPAANHNGGQLQFGPDGYLYIGTGDGGQAGDPWGNAQNPDVLLGKILRINVAGTETYIVPDSNPPLIQPGARPEIWATGLRNPWRFAFDRATGDLYIADVGQNLYEEVDVQPASSPGGENYGWDVMEGSHCFEPPAGCNRSGLVLPVVEYDHGQGCSITGGYVYRGTRYPQMAGVYFFGDFCSGTIWGLQQDASGEWTTALLLNTDVNISSFGEDAAGEVYVIGYSDGTIYHIVASP
jgi:glucose/arabinose dehydrogenase